MIATSRSRRGGAPRSGIYQRSIRLLGVFLLCPLGTGLVAAVAPEEPPFPPAPGGRLHMLYEKTLLKVNVLTLEIQVPRPTAERLGEIGLGPEGERVAREEARVRAILSSPQVWVRMEFLRATSQKRFLGGIRESLKQAEKAGIITSEHRGRVDRQLPEWYGFLASRGVRTGDVLAYWVHGDSLETTYYGHDGAVLFDYAQEDAEARFGVLGGYLAPGSDFRRGLLESLEGSP